MDIVEGDIVELTALDEDNPFPKLSNGLSGRVTGICEGYCMWVEFPYLKLLPHEVPSQKWGFPIYFHEARPIFSPFKPV